MDKDIKKIDKNLIFLKSSVIAMGVIFVVLLAVLVILKNKKINSKPNECNENAIVNVGAEVERVELSDGYILVITKPNNGERGVVKIDRCGKVVDRVILKK